MQFIFILVGVISLFLSEVSGSKLNQFSQFKNFNSTYYNSETGQPALSFSFKEISKESPKLGFLKFSIPFFIVENLSVKIEMEHIKSDSLFADIKEYHQKEAIRFLRARNVKVHFYFKKEKNLLISAHSMKLKNDGSYQFSGSVKVKIDNELFEYPSLSLFFSPGIHDYSLEKQNGQNILKIFESSHFQESKVETYP
jgi:hypothetical protein|tara:strand:- start:43 stop:633 length:591 start_codon:yes stop_codon:yes gene_type:complete